MICTVCGLVIGEDGDVAVEGGPPMCGERARARNFDQLLWEVDAADGDLGGERE